MRRIKMLNLDDTTMDCTKCRLYPEVTQRQAFLKLPVEKRRLLLAEQVKSLSDYYENEAEYLTAEDGVDDY
jgi:hypothetical protein